MTSLRTLRSVGVGLLLASQDLASSLPKNAVRNIVLNTRWSATFQSRADEAELLFARDFDQDFAANSGTPSKKGMFVPAFSAHIKKATANARISFRRCHGRHAVTFRDL